MRHDFLDRYSRLDSPVHRAPAAVKMALALATVVAVVLTPPSRAWWPGIVALALAVVAALSRVPPSFLARRLLLLEPFVLGVAVLSLLQPHGLGVAISIAVRSTLCLATMVLLTNVTPFSEMLVVLRRLRVPPLLVTVLALMDRYLFVLVDEAARMRRARLSRTFTGGRRGAWRASSSLVGQLFVRSTERADRIYAAMCARGWR